MLRTNYCYFNRNWTYRFGLYKRGPYCMFFGKRVLKLGSVVCFSFPFLRTVYSTNKSKKTVWDRPLGFTSLILQFPSWFLRNVYGPEEYLISTSTIEVNYGGRENGWQFGVVYVRRNTSKGLVYGPLGVSTTLLPDTLTRNHRWMTFKINRTYHSTKYTFLSSNLFNCLH